jgi:ribonuclease HI
MSNQTVIACDGSSHKKANGEMRGAVGWAWARDDGAWQSSGFWTGTNQTAELHAIRSVLLMNPKGNLLVQLDSQYALNVTEKWAKGWARKNWIKADGKPVLNRGIIEEILFLRESRQDPIEFQWVKGHLKDNRFPLNTLADKYAGEASARAKSTTNAEESLLLYRDSKGRTSLTQETRMMMRVIARDS